MRNGTIDFMKFISAIFIVFLHALIFMEPQRYIPFTALAVDFFFIVSGHLVYRSVLRKKATYMTQEDLGGKTKRFIVNKIKKIYPEYIVSLVLGYAFLNILFFTDIKSSIRNFILCIGELSFWNLFGFPTDGWSNVGWYIITMFICSLIIFLLIQKLSEDLLLIILPLGIFFSYGFLLRNCNGFIVALETVPYGLVPLGIIRGLAGMLVGCETAIISEKLNEVRVKCLSKWCLTLIELVGYFAYMRMAFMHKDFGIDNIFIICCLSLSIAISFSKKSYIEILFRYKIFNYLGIFSLNIYLNHNYIAYALHNNKQQVEEYNIILCYIVLVILFSALNKFIVNKLREYILL